MFFVLAVGRHCHTLAQQPHPPTQITQTTPNLFTLNRTTGDGVDLWLGQFHRRPVRLAMVRAQHHPTTGDFFIAPVGRADWGRATDGLAPSEPQVTG
ncbi:hypothetical protein [Neorhodopirellula pilleata]|uniref:hypothetical protein n=1 Tax=Neorhodopirellula pilleata TaxID=2714738 RepID=UPI0018CF0FAB|nr:hypothetical protein [Neorhodopirellula pilleata]